MSRIQARLDARCVAAWSAAVTWAVTHGFEQNAYLASVLTHMLRRFRLGHLGVSDLRLDFDRKVSTLRFSVPREIEHELEAVATAAGVRVSQLIRVALVWEGTLRNRLFQESEYRKSGEPGDPEYLSDAFLELWNRNRMHGADTILLQLVRPMLIQIADLQRQISDLREKVEKRDGPLRIPPRSEILQMQAPELVRLSIDHGFAMPTRVGVRVMRRVALKALGFQG